MKTKSKRFLNLATLFLALFGAVWICRPIEARHSTEGTVVRESLRGYYSDSEEEQRVDEAHDRGHADGYKDGCEGNPKKDKEDTPQGIGDSELSDYWDSYDMGYEAGYRLWETEHPVEATLSWIWETITSWIQSIF
ncbi:hypothetical protein [Streptococcus pyogenes]|uniref:hypothetical protein n=1 Tax=Streptococcus pyogenes TaxID=1314 RepID=UPI00109CB4C6|nr:hypothetical protein [Streptococcus pyogenes]QCK28282.1 hypothetical protein ETT71_02200 [Streptococcus pyogenes]VGQ18883.1 hypothetical membrane associated protein [Streptococcus pyogenes]VGQ47483.1 hypothetical membrane associated protein [Streptococcus pyogenes]VGQ82759.1 hypothetical membrane associated protein [Streptococcus pyogenes]VGV33777.1 Uncharacterised protein [Streptococcus pyogenes]